MNSRAVGVQCPQRPGLPLVRRVLGWDGRRGCCLKDAGEEFGITRERARQIYDQAIEQIRTCEVSSTLDEALAFVHAHVQPGRRTISKPNCSSRRFTRHRICDASPAEDGSSIWARPGIYAGGTGGKLFVVAGAGVVRSIFKAALRSSARWGIQTCLRAVLHHS